MRLLVVVLLLAWAGGASAEDYPMSAHIVRAEFIHTTAPSNRRVTEIRIEGRIYIADNLCKHVAVGQDYPARVENEKRIYVLAGEKICKYRVVGVREP